MFIVPSNGPKASEKILHFKNRYLQDDENYKKFFEWISAIIEEADFDRLEDAIFHGMGCLPLDARMLERFHKPLLKALVNCSCWQPIEMLAFHIEREYDEIEISEDETLKRFVRRARQSWWKLAGLGNHFRKNYPPEKWFNYTHFSDELIISDYMMAEVRQGEEGLLAFMFGRDDSTGFVSSLQEPANELFEDLEVSAGSLYEVLFPEEGEAPIIQEVVK